MFYKLVLQNAKRSRQENLIYFGTLITAVASFYMVLSLERQDVVLFLKDFESDAVDKLFSLMPILYLFALFLLFFLILFANNYQLERRSKEFGVYMLLGMRKNRLFLILVAESMMTSAVALVSGIGIGALLAELLSLTTSRLIGQGIIRHQLSFSIQATIYTIIGFLFIQTLALFLLSGKLFNRDLYTLLHGNIAKKQKMGKIKNKTFTFFLGVIVLLMAYYLILRYFKVLNIPMILLAIILGIFGTIWVIGGLSSLLNTIVYKRNRTKELQTFTLRQLQESIVGRSVSIAVTSILMMFALVLISEGSSLILSSADQLQRKVSVYDFTVEGENEKVYDFLTSEAMSPYVENLNPMEIGRLEMIETEDGVYESDLDWSKLREKIIINLPEGVEDPSLTDSDHYSIGPEQSEAENLLNLLDSRMTSYIIKGSSYDRLLEAGDEKPLDLADDEVAIYLNPDFNVDQQPLLTSVLKEAQTNNQPLTFMETTPMHIRSSIPLKGLVTDRSINITMALVVSDTFFEDYADPLNIGTYWNFTIPKSLAEEKGLMAPMQEASALLHSTGFQFESYLQNFGRQLFYIIAGSYTMLYLGFLFLIIGCTVLALQFLTQFKQIKRRYRTLLFLGAKGKQISHSIRQQILWYFLFPLVPALTSGIVGVLALNHYTSFNADFLPSLVEQLPYLIVVVVIFLLVQSVYAMAVYRTANYEINQQQFK